MNNAANSPTAQTRAWIVSEDWLAVLLGSLLLITCAVAVYSGRTPDSTKPLNDIAAIQGQLRHLNESTGKIEFQSTETGKEIRASLEKDLERRLSTLYQSPLKNFFAKIGSWKSDPRDAFFRKGEFIGWGLAGVLIFSLTLFAIGMSLSGQPIARFCIAYLAVFALALISYLLAGQEAIKY